MQITNGHSYTINGQTFTAANNNGKCATTCWIRNPIPGNKLANLAGYTPDKVGAKLLSYYPAATGSGLTNNLIVSGAAPAHSDEYTVRVDQNINDNTEPISATPTKGGKDRRRRQLGHRSGRPGQPEAE